MSEEKQKHAGGRPLKYKTVDEMQKLIDGYFESCFTDKPIIDKNGDVIGVERVQIRPYTITGLGLALDMDREGLLNYQGRAEFFDAITRAKRICHNYAEELSMTAKNPNGVLFNLKNNYGWKDKNETEITGKDGSDLTINVTISDD
jgi:hypothetical protein